MAAELLLRVGYDGTGSSVQQGEAAGLFGLTGLREWAQLVGGEPRNESRPGQGTTRKLKIRG
jgi:signal transduction histidine kinase